MEILNSLLTILLIVAVTVPEIYSDGIAARSAGSLKPPLVVNPIEELTFNQNNKPKPEQSLAREKRQNNKPSENNKAKDAEKQKPPANFNPLEDLILNQDKNGFEPGASLSRVKRQYRQYPYPYPYPIPILIGGGFGVYGGRGFGGRGFGSRGFGGRGFGGGIGGRGIGGSFGGRGGVGGGFGGGRGGGGGRG